MVLNAGAFDRRIQVQVAEYDEYGVPTGYSDQLSDAIAARRRDVSDGERFQYGGLSNNLLTRFIVRSSSLTRGIDHSDRLVHEGLIFEITAIKEVPDRRRAFLEITAENSGEVYDPEA